MADSLVSEIGYTALTKSPMKCLTSIDTLFRNHVLVVVVKLDELGQSQDEVGEAHAINDSHGLFVWSWQVGEHFRRSRCGEEIAQHVVEHSKRLDGTLPFICAPFLILGLCCHYRQL